MAAHPGDVPGYPDRRELVAAYAEVSTLDLSGLDWQCRLRPGTKVARALRGIRHRHDEGLTVGEDFERLGPRFVPHLLDSARDA